MKYWKIITIKNNLSFDQYYENVFKDHLIQNFD